MVTLSKSITVKILKVDCSLHQRRRIYPRKIIEDSILNASLIIQKKLLFVSLKFGTTTSLTNIIGIVTNMTLQDDDYVYITIKFLDVPAFHKFAACINAMPWLDLNKMFNIVALGTLRESFIDDEPASIMEDYEIIGVKVASLRGNIRDVFDT